MKDADRAILLEYAAMLSQLGVEVDKARDYILWLNDRGVACDTNAMHQAVRDYQEAKELFDNLEKQYLACADGRVGTENDRRGGEIDRGPDVGGEIYD